MRVRRIQTVWDYTDINMRFFFLTIISAGLLAGCTSRSFNYPLQESFGKTATISAALFDPLAPLYPDTATQSGLTLMHTDVARDSTAGAALLIRSLSESDQIRLRISTGSVDVEIFELIPIPVWENTGYFGMTEHQIGFDNRHVVRDAPFEIFEVLVPKKEMELTGKSIYALYLKARIPSGETGSHPIRIDILDQSGRRSPTLEWMIRLHDVAMPSGDGNELYYTNWFRGPRTGYQERFDESWWQVMEHHLAFMREGGQNTVLIPRYVVFDDVDGSWIPNFDRLDRFMTLCEDLGFLLFEGPRPAGRKNGFLNKGVIVKPGRLDTFTEAASESIFNAYHPLYEFLEERGSLDVWVQHILDEPYGKHAEDYQWVAAQMNRAMPGIRIIDATKTRSGLVGAVDIWSPLVSKYQNHRNFFTERQQAGDEVWIYSCMVPGGAWLNRTMDQERLRSVYVGWGAAKFGVTGYLRWDLDSWRESQDIWAGELTGSEKDWVRRPFGDGFVVYPDGSGGFLSTTRWEAGRMGMEDYRLLMQLKDTNPDRFDEVVAICFSDFKTYETDPRLYRKAKRMLLETLEP